MAPGVTKIVEGGGPNGVNSEDWANYWIVFISADDLKSILGAAQNGLTISNVFVKTTWIKATLVTLGLVVSNIKDNIKDGIWFHLNKVSLIPLFPNKPICGWQ